MMQTKHRPIILIVMDGWGYSEVTSYNAIACANKPVWDGLWQTCPRTLINASGTNVGLPGDQMGNSEVGHMNIGSGRIIGQDLTRISQAIEDGSFFSNEVLTRAFHSVADKDKAIHIMGLLSDGGVHSHQDQIFALMDLAKQQGVKRIYLHAFLDGRDTPPRSAGQYITDAQNAFSDIGKGQIASITGRYYAMDRNNNWDRLQLAYDLLTQGKTEYTYQDPQIALRAAYARDESDEFVKPSAVLSPDQETIHIEDGDGVIFANFRADRARQLSMAFTEKTFVGFERELVPALENYISMTKYKAAFTFPVAYPPQTHKNVLGEILASKGLHQLRIAETEKYAHVTFFFNGGEESVFENEDRILVPSPDVATYDMKPEMSAFEVSDKLVEAINGGKYDAIICNFANTDMVGHTGDFDAAVKAVETVDQCLGKIIEACSRVGGEVLITSDHGNAEQMRAHNENNDEAHTAHTNNLVPFLYVGRKAEAVSKPGALSDIAPTMLYLMGLERPAEMTGNILLKLLEHEKKAVAEN